MGRNTGAAGAARTAALGVAVAFILGGCSMVDDLVGGGEPEPERDPATGQVSDVVEGASILDIRAGDCLGEISSSAEVQRVDIIPCGQQYQQQVFLITEINSDQFPDQATVESQAQEECLPAFNDFIGVAYEGSELDISYLSPSKEGWESGEDRDLVCLVYDPAGTVTGSLEGINR